MSHLRGLRCIRCGQEWSSIGMPPIHSHPGREDDRFYAYLDVTYDYAAISDFPVLGDAALSRYLPLLPIEQLGLSMGEGNTPLIPWQHSPSPAEWWIKDESRNPTGCFKDREALIGVTKAFEEGSAEVYVVSSGNGAVSTGAYARRAGIHCRCYVPEDVPSYKQDRLAVYCPDVQPRSGDYEDIYRSLLTFPPEGWNCTPGINPYCMEGAKTIAFEIWEEIGVPDVVMIPCGNGTGLAGIWKGFCELFRLEKADCKPRMFGVQLQDSAPLAAALASEKDHVGLPFISASVAGGILAKESYTAPKALQAIRDSAGSVIQVSDEEIVSALKDVVEHEALLPEPTSASVFAAARKLELANSMVAVCILTASGQKDLGSISLMLATGQSDRG